MNEILTKIVNTLSKLEKRVSNEDKIAKAIQSIVIPAPVLSIPDKEVQKMFRLALD
jgi:hypothetical protein